MKKRSIGIVSICSLLFFAMPALAEEDGESRAIEGVGEAEIRSGNTAKAREEALFDAMGMAITDVARSVLSPALFTKNSDVIEERIAKQQKLLVRDYRLLGHTKREGKVEVRAVVDIRVERVRSELARWGILFDRVKRPTFGVYPFQDRVQSKLQDTASMARHLVGRLRDLGYTAEILARSKGAEGEAPPTFDILLWGSYGLRAKKALSIEVRSSLRNVKSNLPKVRGSFSLKEGKGLAAGLVVTALLERVLPHWFRHIGRGRLYEISVRGLRSYSAYKKLREVLDSGRNGFLSADELAYGPGRVMFKVVFDGETEALVRLLRNRKVVGVKLSVDEVRGQTLHVFAVK